MTEATARAGYVHGYSGRENQRLLDQASSLADLLHWDTVFPVGSRVLEAGCGIGAQTVTIAQNNPEARILSVDVAASSLAAARNLQGIASHLPASKMSPSSKPTFSTCRFQNGASIMSSFASFSNT